jgi:class 3 adenylate cyclase
VTSDKKKLLRAALAIPRDAVVKREELKTPRLGKAYALFLDISGYTPFAESIIRSHEERGIGKLVETLEAMLQPVAQTALMHNGNIVAVEGDALLITFERKKDALDFCTKIQPKRAKSVEALDGTQYDLMIDIGIAHGNLYEFVAQDQGRRSYIATGSALRSAYNMEKYSTEGNIVSNFPMDGAQKKRDSEGNVYFVSAELGKRLLRRLFRAKPELNPKHFRDSDYLDSFGSTNLKGSRNQILAPVSIFSDFPLIALVLRDLKSNNPKKSDPQRIADALNEFYSKVRGIIELGAEGFIDKFKDENSMFTIGAPLTFDDARLRAFEAVVKIHEIHGKMCKKYGIPPVPAISGLHKGDAFCGHVLERYTSLGDSVNLAARVKSSRSGHSLSPEHDQHIFYTREMLTDQVARSVKGYELERSHLKGVEDTRTIFGFSTIIEFSGAEEFILRSEEHQEIVQKALNCIKTGEGLLLNVLGDLGSGRDRLLSLVAQRLDGEMETHEIRCSPFFKKEPYRAVLELMKKVYFAFSDEELFRKAIGRIPKSEADFAEMEKRFEEKLLEEPRAYIINNGENIDRKSVKFLDKISPRLVEYGCFAAYSGGTALFSRGEHFILGNLSSERSKVFTKMLAKKLFAGAQITDIVVAAIFKKSQGNPLFISELVKSLYVKDGILRLRRRKPSANLRDIMLMNVRSLPQKLQLALDKYSLMHSVPVMAPLVDPKADSNIKALQSFGFLDSVGEFTSDLLCDSVAQSITSKRKAKLYEELLKKAEAAGLADHLALFDYSRNSAIDPKSKLKALEHADQYIRDTGFLYLVREEIFDEAIAVADKRFKRQRHMLGIMLYRKTIVLNAQYADDEHPKKIQRMESLLKDARNAHKYLKGHDFEYKAMLQVGMALSFLANFEMLEGKDKNKVTKKLTESQELIKRSRQMAYEAGDIAYFLAASSSFSHSLIYHHENPGSAFLMLKDTESEYKRLPKGSQKDDILPRVANLYMTMADTAQMMKDYLGASEFIEIALKMNEKLNYIEGLSYSLGVKAKILAGMNDAWAARDYALHSLKMVEGKDILAADFIRDMKKIIEDAERLKSGVSGQIS